MKEMTNLEPKVQMRSTGSSKVIIAAIIAAVIITVACVGGFVATVILILDEIPFHHIFAS